MTAGRLRLKRDGLFHIANATGTTTELIDEHGNMNIVTSLEFGDGDSIVDSNANELIKFAVTSSAVNEVSVTNAATASGPILSATGGDTNIDITLKGKGTGSVILGQSTATGVKLAADQPIADSSGNELLKFVKTTSAVNEISIANAATGGFPTISCTGEADTGIDFENSEGEEILKLDAIASAVNEITIKNAATGNFPQICATGEADTGLVFMNSEGEEILILDSIASSVNEVTIKSAATGNMPIIAATGEADTGLRFENGESEAILVLDAVATGVNNLMIANATTTNDVALTVTGDTAVSGLTLAGKAGGAAGVLGGVMTLSGGAGNTTGAGGAASLIAGVGGNDAVGGIAEVKGGAAGGGNRAGGNAKLTGGAGAGNGGAGAGGSVVLTAGAAGADAPGGSVTATATAGTGNSAGGDIIHTAGAGAGTGVNGAIFQRSTSGLYFHKMAAPTAKTTNATLTVAEILAGWITVSQGAGGTSTQTTPTGTELVAALPASLAAGDCFDFHIINISTNGAEDAILAFGADITGVGNLTVNSNDAIGSQSQGTFRFRYSGTNVWIAYRIS